MWSLILIELFQRSSLFIFSHYVQDSVLPWLWLPLWNCSIHRSSRCLELTTLNFLTMNLIEFQFLLQWCSNLETLGIKLDGDYTCTVYHDTMFGASKRAKRAFSENSIYELWYGNQENIHRRLFLQGRCKAKEYWGKKIVLSFPRASQKTFFQCLLRRRSRTRKKI